MKRLIQRVLIIMALALGLFAFTSRKEGGIRGTVNPADGATLVVAVAGTDTLQAQISNGNFVFAHVKPATYTVWVKAKPPYKDTTIANVAVIESTVTDVGEIKLEQ